MDEEQRPAERGATVLLTRSAAQGAAFARALAEEWEAERAAKPSARESTSEETREGDNGEGPRDPAAPRVLFAPLQQARTVPATEELRGIPALLESGAYAWVSFTSAHTVRACAELWGEDFARAVHAGGARIACVGAATARAVRTQLGLDADFQPSVQSAAGMLAELEGPAVGAVSSDSAAAGPDSTKPATVLVLEGSNARPTLREGLKNLGWSVTARVLYDMVPAERVEPGELSLAAARALLRGADAPAPETLAPDVIVATAPSRLHALLDGAPALGPESVPPVVAIGATTASACRALNLRHVQADSPSPRDLARAAVSLI